MGCPRLADFRFNHNFQSIGGKSNSLECGSIVHKFLETFYGCLINGLRREAAIGFAFASAELYIKGCPSCSNFESTSETKKPICGHKPNEYPGVKNTPPDNEREPHVRTGWKWVLETCQQYVDFWRNDHWVPLEVEVVKSKVLYEDDEVRVLWKAKLDWIADTNQGIYPIDHKTMKANRKTLKLNNQFKGQCILMNTHNVFKNIVGFQTTLKPEEKFLRPPISYSTPDLMEWQYEILPYYSKLLLMYAETGYWPPNFEHCEGKYGHCSFVKVCESDPGERENEIKQLFIVGEPWNPTNDDDSIGET
jgi:hypothetical protein